MKIEFIIGVHQVMMKNGYALKEIKEHPYNGTTLYLFRKSPNKWKTMTAYYPHAMIDEEWFSDYEKDFPNTPSKTKKEIELFIKEFER